MKLLIVNADDLGLGPGTTRGILEAHAHGIVTSTSLMVNTPWSREAAMLARPATRLSVGLHADLGPAGDPRRSTARETLERQIDRFATLMGRAPTHLDSHHNAHLDVRLHEIFLGVADRAGLPLRGSSPARYYSKFYGQWAGESHPEHVSIASLIGMLAREVGEGITELGCHPGFDDRLAPSSYRVERPVELATLCDPRLPAAIAALGITLASFHDLDRIAKRVRSGRRRPKLSTPVSGSKAG